MRTVFFAILVLVGACDSAQSQAPQSETAIFSQRVGPSKEATLTFEFRDAGWRNVRNLHLITTHGPDQSSDLLAYWVCNHKTIIVPTRYAKITEERRSALGLRSGMGDEITLSMQRSGNEIGPFFDLDRAGAVKLLEALDKTCKQVPGFVEPPENILMSYSETGSLTHFEPASFVRNGSLASAWERDEKFEKVKPAGESEEVWVLSNPTPLAKGLVQYDCSNGSLERQTLVLFNRDGSHADTMTGGLKIPQVVPGTIDEANLKAVCLFE